jgi:Galactose oxidase, central domain
MWEMVAMGTRSLVTAVVLLLVVSGCTSGGTGSKSASSSPSSSAPGVTVVAECGRSDTPDEPGPASQARPEWLGGSAAVDSQSGRLVLGEAGYHGRLLTWAFDVCTNRWQSMRGGVGLDYATLVYDAAADLIVALPLHSGPAGTYSVDTDTWTALPDVPPFYLAATTGTDAVLDPNTGRVLTVSAGVGAVRVWAYDRVANSVTQLGGPGPTPGSPSTGDLGEVTLTVDPAANRLVVALMPHPPGYPGQTLTFDLATNTWTDEHVEPPFATYNEALMGLGNDAAFDPVAGRTVVYNDGVMATYQTGADHWDVIAPGAGWPTHGSVTIDGATQWTGPLARQGHTLVYDPANQRILMIGGYHRSAKDPDPPQGFDLSPDDVWAYDVPTNTWTELVAASSQ